MAGRPSVLSDEKIYKDVIEKMAMGLSPRLIADSLRIPEVTVRNWRMRKDFKRDLALREMELAVDPISQVRKSQPLTWLQKKFKGEWDPPPRQIEGECELLIAIKKKTDATEE